jgi:UDP-N-acetylglucosamine--N-acetylmuramyl-(pentapeptide) pyrophosphoryl-undecaprenol N-acetylglucosamine transferase
MIGYYVHHHGSGHLQRATSIATASRIPVVALSSLDVAVGAFAAQVKLPRDDVDPDAHDHSAGGALHWAPLGASGYRERMAAVADWLTTARPSVVVVDVSVEVAVLCRSMGVPVVVVAGAGERNDAAHELVHRIATRIIAPWPRRIYEPAHLRPFAAKTSYVGAFSRFDGTAVTPQPDTRSVTVLFGTGGGDVDTDDLAAAREATPGWTWRAHGLPGTQWCTDVWAAMAESDVVVTHAGQNAVAEVAAVQRPALVLPQRRPFGEQLATAAALDKHGLATMRTAWPTSDEWPTLLTSLQSRGGADWSRWNRGDGARTAARCIEDLLRA